jgi:hypothetical protein
MSPFPFFKARLLGSLEMANKSSYGRKLLWEKETLTGTSIITSSFSLVFSSWHKANIIMER